MCASNYLVRLCFSMWEVEIVILTPTQGLFQGKLSKRPLVPQKGIGKKKRVNSIRVLFITRNVDTQICFKSIAASNQIVYRILFSRFLQHHQRERPFFIHQSRWVFGWEKPMDAVEQVEIYLTLDHPHVARLLMVYEDEQVGGVHPTILWFGGGFVWWKKMVRESVVAQGWVMTGRYYEKVFTESEICINIIDDTSSPSDPHLST